MPGFGQLLHEEEYLYGGNRYRLTVHRVEGGLSGQWCCETCMFDNDDHECPTYASLDACLSSMKREIRKHHRMQHSP